MGVWEEAAGGKIATGAVDVGGGCGIFSFFFVFDPSFIYIGQLRCHHGRRAQAPLPSLWGNLDLAGQTLRDIASEM